MKKVISGLLFISLLSSCASLPEPESLVGIVDYTPLIKSGIFVTESNSVNFDYTAVGSIVATEKGGWINGKAKRPTTEGAFKNIIKELNAIGANGIINLNIIPSVEMSDVAMSKVYVSVITVKGMAIKIPDSKLKKVTDISSIFEQMDNQTAKDIKRSNKYPIGSSVFVVVDSKIKKCKITDVNAKDGDIYYTGETNTFKKIEWKESDCSINKKDLESK